jgi:hypothetical protein
LKLENALSPAWLSAAKPVLSWPGGSATSPPEGRFARPLACAQSIDSTIGWMKADAAEAVTSATSRDQDEHDGTTHITLFRCCNTTSL